MADYVVDHLQGDKELLFKVATRHFVKSVQYLPSLVRAMRLVLNLGER